MTTNVRASRPKGRPPASDGPSARERLLASARREFSAKGFRGAATGDIAEAAGLTPPALYHHFENKSGLFVAVVEDVYEQVLHRFGEAVPAGASFDEAVDGLLACSIEVMRTDPTLSAMVATAHFEIRREPELGLRLRPVLRRFRAFFDDVAARAKPAGQSTAHERRSLSHALVAIITGLNAEALLLGRDQDYAALVQAMRTLLRTGTGSD
ncbi:TetR/AcrR family transcriptional regulator [Dactylosporangium sp. NPDC005572]|uniref:TetR/AcrR family transcriptional regulator n=1 Tax=Dactylosporangium sp. NPDC005572 TaxID=3156889 RepID=UPI00339EBCEC